jgi:hypothetical protein
MGNTLGWVDRMAIQISKNGVLQIADSPLDCIDFIFNSP